MRYEKRAIRANQITPEWPRRRGASLIEMLLVISILATVITITGMTIQLLLRSEKIVSRSLVTERTIARLANLFRNDVHRAETGVEAADKGAFELRSENSEGTQVRYLISKERLTRTIIEGNEIVSRDDFNLPDCQIRIVQDPQANAGFLSLMIERPTVVFGKNSQAPTPLRKLEIQARLGQSKRLLASFESKKEETKIVGNVQEEK